MSCLGVETVLLLSYLNLIWIQLNLSRFDLQFEQITSQVSVTYVKLLLEEYEPVNNRYNTKLCRYSTITSLYGDLQVLFIVRLVMFVLVNIWYYVEDSVK